MLLLLALFAVIVGAAIVQLVREPPAEPFPGPVSGTPLPSGITTATSPAS